ncbi:hypothetical protein [Streptomyces sp. NPDC059593]|uniref:hypothetical protein n=1 Tax=Streptomyces sp. NPDC059593 TaxID=3346878 RepID=UPI0036C9E7E5
MPPPTPRKPSKTCLAVALALGGIVVLAGTAVVALLGTVEAQTGTTPRRARGRREDHHVRGGGLDEAAPRRSRRNQPQQQGQRLRHQRRTRVAVGRAPHTEAHTSITHPAPEQVAHDRAGSPTQVNAPVTCRITNVIRVTP